MMMVIECEVTGCFGEWSGLRGTKWEEDGDNYIIRSIIILLLTKY